MDYSLKQIRQCILTPPFVVPLEKVILTLFPSGFYIPDNKRDAIALKKNELERSKDTHKHEGKLVRYEGYRLTESAPIETGTPTVKTEPAVELHVRVSFVEYSQQAILSKVKELPPECYPNPIGMTTIQIARRKSKDDGNIPLGLHTGDHGGTWVLVGSGFIDRDKDGPLETAARYALIREINEETKIRKNKRLMPQGKIDESHIDSYAIAIIKGMHHTVGIGTVSNVAPGINILGAHAGEHARLERLPNTPQALDELLRTGHIDNLPVSDQALAALLAYHEIKKSGHPLRKQQ